MYVGAVPVAVGLQVGAIVSELLGAGGKFIGRRLGVKARKHDQIRVLAESKLNTIADRISTALTDDKISEEEFRLILSEVDKYDQMKAEIRRGCQNRSGLSEKEKKQLLHLMRDEAMLAASTSSWKSSTKLVPVEPLDKHLASSKKSAGWSNPFKQQKVEALKSGSRSG